MNGKKRPWCKNFSKSQKVASHTLPVFEFGSTDARQIYIWFVSISNLSTFSILQQGWLQLCSIPSLSLVFISRVAWSATKLSALYITLHHPLQNITAFCYFMLFPLFVTVLIIIISIHFTIIVFISLLSSFSWCFHVHNLQHPKRYHTTTGDATSTKGSFEQDVSHAKQKRLHHTVKGGATSARCFWN